MVEGVQAVGEFGPPEESCGGGQGNACDLPVSGIVAPSSPADDIKKSLRVDMFKVSRKFPRNALGANAISRTLYRRHGVSAMSPGNDSDGTAASSIAS